ncbi:MAG: hypothetical protein ABL998_24000 [Planctomycetota bacterium]
MAPEIQAELALAVPAWWPEAVLWLGVALLFLAAVVVYALFTLHRRLEALHAELRPLATLAELQRTLQAALAGRDALDLRRIEHVLIDLRDGTRRVEEQLLRLAEQRQEAASSSALVALAPPSVAERIQNRLFALGYERVELIAPSAEVEALAQGEGEVRVEARREGALCKGRVRLRAGRIEAVQLEPAYPIFP